MSNLILVSPTKAHELAALEYRQEHFDTGEMLLHGGSLFDSIGSYDAWLNHLKASSSPDTVQPGWVVSSTFFALRPTDNRIIGLIDIRHELNNFLRSYGGHIGYGVRPTERKKGYASRMLLLALDYCRQLCLDKVMLACEKDNEASRKTIVNCGGVLEREFLHTDGKLVQIYWITL